jgi:hypothetical protein
MDDKTLDILAEKAYLCHLGAKKNDSERYFKVDYCPWCELPLSTRKHWQNIVLCIFREYDGLSASVAQR